MRERLLKFIRSGFVDVLFFLAVFLPYLSPLPLRGTDIQPFFIPVSFGFLVLGFLFRGWRPDSYEWRFLGAALFFFGYLNWFDFSGSWSVMARKNSGLLLGWMIFVCSRRMKRVPVTALYVVSGAYVAACFVQLVSPALHARILLAVMSTVRTAAVRGVTGLCPEPSFLAVMGLCFVVFIASWANFRKKHLYTLLLLSFLLVFMSRSATGIILLIALTLVFMTVHFRFAARMALVAPVALLICFAAYQSSCFFVKQGNSPRIENVRHKNNRQGSLLTAKKTSRPSGSFQSGGSRWEVVQQGARGVVYDISCLKRLVSLGCGVGTIFYYPLGTGQLFNPDVAVQIARSSGLSSLFAENADPSYAPKYFRKFCESEGITEHYEGCKRMVEHIAAKTGYLNALAAHFQRMGAAFLLVLVIVFSKKSYWRRCNWPVLMLACVCWGFSTPLVFPPLWFLLGWNTNPARVTGELCQSENQPDHSNL